MYLALAVLTAAALWFAASDATVRMTTLQMYEGRDGFLVVASLVILVLVSASLLMPARRALCPG